MLDVEPTTDVVAYSTIAAQAFTIETGSEALVALSFHGVHPVLCTADSKGFLRVFKYSDNSGVSNTFHMVTGECRDNVLHNKLCRCSFQC